jgi:hypothetical protein
MRGRGRLPSIALVATLLALPGACSDGRNDFGEERGAPRRRDQGSTTTTADATARAAPPGTPTTTTPRRRGPSAAGRSPAPTGAARPYASNAGFAHGFELVRREPPEAVDADLDLMVSTGARWLRVSVGWGHVERVPGAYDWAGTDHVVRGAVDRGLSIVAVIGTAPAWDAVGGCSGFECAPAHPSLFADFARLVVQRYAPLGVRHWEIWNEPNHVAFWSPRPDPVTYTELLRVSAGAIRAVDPGATVITGGFSPASDDGAEVAPLTFLRGIYEAGGAPYFDAVGHHPYQYPEPPTIRHPANAFLQTERLHALMASYGDGAKPIWGTEVGAPTRGARGVSEAEQATWVLEYYRRWNAWPFTGPLLWYTARDRGDDDSVEDSYGLVRNDRTPKPALRAFTALMRPTATPVVRG